MARYRLDDLGWYQFENLVQAALKSELGIGVESWGGRGDFGRDAFCRRALKFPSKDVLSDGPFVFQMKFVQSANSTGATVKKPLLDAIQKERSLISARIQSKEWEHPKCYALYTNAPITADLRQKIEDILRPVLTDSLIASFGSSDISDLLDNNPSLRRSYPQLLSIGDLNTLLADVVNAETLQRSKAALLAGETVLPVFVPTRAYNRTWTVLQKHYFGVLEGPPEMGKTAIAWLLSFLPPDDFPCPAASPSLTTESWARDLCLYPHRPNIWAPRSLTT